MNISGYKIADTANGEGVRVSLFVSGCTNHCPGCFNQSTWDFNAGTKWTPELETKFLQELSKPFYDGLTILGGEPFELQNQDAVLALITKVRTICPKKTIWMYTGNVYDKDLVPGGKRYIPNVTDHILEQIDVLVDGPFILAEKDITLDFRGSKNQRIIDMEKTLSEGGDNVILYRQPSLGC